MARTLGPAMPPMPRAGSAIVRDSSVSTIVCASTEKPAPPYSSGTSIFQKPRSLARLAEALVIFRLELLAARQRRLPLDRNHLGVDEAPQRLLEDAQFFGKLEVH